MGSEMCIRDRDQILAEAEAAVDALRTQQHNWFKAFAVLHPHLPCLLYTSDAADERSSVDLGGRRIITNKIHADYTCSSC